MAIDKYMDEEMKPMAQNNSTPDRSRSSLDSVTSASTTSIALERLDRSQEAQGNDRAQVPSEMNGFQSKDEDYDEEVTFLHKPRLRPVEKKAQRILWYLGGLCL